MNVTRRDIRDFAFLLIYSSVGDQAFLMLFAVAKKWYVVAKFLLTGG